ncbi:36570_t:CDS:2 [Racocetra persica]|uniref:36570_t:CDS:1 n=1 Tax=Racocetra persica TaxID=160502 RepID=A0ACA9L3Z8_9GLOM|nr:36570_t:CDS:2 [Racocetra persica]
MNTQPLNQENFKQAIQSYLLKVYESFCLVIASGVIIFRIENNIYHFAQLGFCDTCNIIGHTLYLIFQQKSESEDFKEINAFLIHAHETSLELFILDQKFEPFFRLRRLSNISVPYKQGTIGGVIDLVQNLLTFRNILICTLNKLKEIDNLFKMKPQFVAKESKKQNEDNKSNFIRIPTLNTPLK